MRHKLCRSFHPWCPGVKNRCLLYAFYPNEKNIFQTLNQLQHCHQERKHENRRVPTSSVIFHISWPLTCTCTKLENTVRIKLPVCCYFDYELSKGAGQVSQGKLTWLCEVPLTEYMELSLWHQWVRYAWKVKMWKLPPNIYVFCWSL